MNGWPVLGPHLAQHAADQIIYWTRPPCQVRITMLLSNYSTLCLGIPSIYANTQEQQTRSCQPPCASLGSLPRHKLLKITTNAASPTISSRSQRWPH
eukprot:4965021-Amphidinium_carterae.1